MFKFNHEFVPKKRILFIILPYGQRIKDTKLADKTEGNLQTH